jgi:hypothetical protein
MYQSGPPLTKHLSGRCETSRKRGVGVVRQVRVLWQQVLDREHLWQRQRFLLRRSERQLRCFQNHAGLRGTEPGVYRRILPCLAERLIGRPSVAGPEFSEFLPHPGTAEIVCVQQLLKQRQKIRLYPLAVSPQTIRRTR